MDYSALNTLYWLRDAVACLGVLVGVGGAIFLFVRKKTLAAVLSLIGFVFLGLEPLLDMILWRILINGDNPNYDLMSTTYVCITGPALFVGIVLIVLAFILGFRGPKLPPPPIEVPTDLPPIV
jgi:hypothetical protein